MESMFTSPVVLASCVSGAFVLVAAWAGRKAERYLTLSAKAANIAESGLSAQLAGWGAYTDRLEKRISEQDGQIAGLQMRIAELNEHNRKQDDALYDCEKKNLEMISRIQALEKRVSEHEQE